MQARVAGVARAASDCVMKSFEIFTSAKAIERR
jgi:hypothetical protein